MEKVKSKRIFAIVLTVMTCFMMCFGDMASIMAAGQEPQADQTAGTEASQELEETANTNAEFVENDSDIGKKSLAFETAYIASHYNKDYVSCVYEDSLFYPVAFARANASYTRTAKDGKYDDSPENFVGAGEYSILIYDVDPDSKYYAAIANVNLADNGAKPYCVDVIWNNYSGVELEDVYYDEDTSILYIAKDYIDNPDADQVGEDSLSPIAIQSVYLWDEKYLEDGSADFSKHVPVIVMDIDDGDFVEKTVDVNNMFDVTTMIPSVVEDPADYKAEDFNITVNGQFATLTTDDYGYDEETGNIVIAKPASTISSIMITVPHKGILSKTVDRYSVNAKNISFDSMKALKVDGEVVKMDDDAYNNLYVGWRGKYGKSDVNNKSTAYHGGTGKFKKYRGYMDSLNYMYRPETITAAWALTTYTRGRDFLRGNETDYEWNDKHKSYSSSKKKTAYEWFKTYRDNIRLYKEHYKNPYHGHSLYATLNSANGGFQGFNCFAIRFSKTIHGTTNLVSSGDYKGVTNKTIDFGSKCHIGSGTILACCCRHFKKNSYPSNAGGTLANSNIYVSCLAKGQDQHGGYVVLMYVIDKKVGRDAQEGYSIYKFRTEDEPEPQVKTVASENHGEPGHTVVTDKISSRYIPNNTFKAKSSLIVSDAVDLSGTAGSVDADDIDDAQWDDGDYSDLEFGDLEDEDADIAADDEGGDESGWDAYVSIAGGTICFTDEALAQGSWRVVVKNALGNVMSDDTVSTSEYDVPTGDLAEGDYTAFVYAPNGEEAMRCNFTITPGDDGEIEIEEEIESGDVVATDTTTLPTSDKDWKDTNITMKATDKTSTSGKLYLDLGDFFKGPSAANQTVKMGIQTEVTGTKADGKAFKKTHNAKLDVKEENLEIHNPFGWLSWTKVSAFNYDKSVTSLEVGAKFQVYKCDEFNSYDEALADQEAKGYKTYKFAQAMQTFEDTNGNNKWDKNDKAKLAWSNDGEHWYYYGNLMPGKYRIVQVTTGTYYKSMSMAEPWEMTVEKDVENEYPGPGKEISNETTYPFDLTLQKISADKYETDDPNHEGDGKYQHSPLQNDETAFRVQSLNDDGTLSVEGYDRTFNLTEENNSQITIKNLLAGKYRITEVQVPTGYYMPEDAAYVEVSIVFDQEKLEHQITVDKIHQSESGFTKIDVRDQNNVDDEGRLGEGDEDTAETVSTGTITWTKSNIPQDTSLSIKKDRKFKNEAGKEELKAFPNVEFNLYAVGDIIAYDGHGNHKYYSDGQLIQGIVIDQDTGERHFYVDGVEVKSGDKVPVYDASVHYYKWQTVDNIQKYRILTDNNGQWDSTKASSNAKNTYIEYLGADSSTFPYYPLTNNNMINVFDGNEPKDGESGYKLQEAYVWEAGAHVSFTVEQKTYWRNIWTENLGQDAEAEIPGVGMTFNQILNHGIDITYEKTTDSQGNTDKTMRYSSNGKYLDGDELIKRFLKDRMFEFIEEGKASITNENNETLGSVDWKTWVLDPDAELAYDIENTNEEFKVLPMASNVEHNQHASTFVNDELIGIPQTVAVNNATGKHRYNPEQDKKITIVDTVRYQNFDVDKEYELVGTLMNKATGEPILHDGEPITATAKFTPENRTGKTKVFFRDVNVEDLEGASIVVFEKCYLEGDLIAEHEDINDADQTIYPTPNIGTEASWDGERVIKETLPAKEVTLTDKVEYHGLTPGKEYTITGYLYNADTMEPILQEGVTMPENASENGMKAVNKDTGAVNLKKLDTLDAAVTAEATFTPEDSDGVIEIVFTFNAVGLQGTKIVTFEEDKTTREDEDYLIHANINDDKQITFIPEIKTEAKADDIDMACADTTVTIVDKVTYTKLEPNKNHKMEGVLMDQETGEPVLVDGNEVRASAEFTSSETGDGEVEMTFTFDAAGLEGHNLVVFEKCYNAEGDVVAEHEDINDVPQTIVIPKVRTTAVDSKTDTHLAELTEKQKVIDVVKYSNLIGGREYKVSGVLMDKQTGEPLKDAKGNEFTAEKTFTVPATEGVEEGALDLVSGEVELEFTVDATALEGTSAVAFEELYFQDKLVGEHKDIEDKKQTVSYPSVRTMALDDLTKDHVAAFADKEVVKDTVKMTGLIKGDEYTVKGTLMDKKTGNPITIDGKPVTAEKTFIAGGAAAPAESEQAPEATAETGDQNTGDQVADGQNDGQIEDEDQNAGTGDQTAETGDQTEQPQAEQPAAEEPAAEEPAAEEPAAEEPAAEEEIEFVDETIELEFIVDSTKLAGTTAVAFEELYYKDILVGAHRDINDKDQTIYYPEIATKATAKNGDKTLKPESRVTIVDKVTYKNLVPGKEYTVSGVLMDKSTGKELMVNGSTVTASKKFTPKEANGSVDIQFTLNASSLNGKSAVVFETMMLGNITVAEHKDIKDKDQTVSFSKKKNPSPTPGKTSKSVKHPLTGDSGFPLWTLILLAVALAGAAGAMVYRKKHAEQTESKE